MGAEKSKPFPSVVLRAMGGFLMAHVGIVLLRVTWGQGSSQHTLTLQVTSWAQASQTPLLN